MVEDSGSGLTGIHSEGGVKIGGWQIPPRDLHRGRNRDLL